MQEDILWSTVLKEIQLNLYETLLLFFYINT